MENTNVDVDCISSEETDSKHAKIKVIGWINYKDAEDNLRPAIGCTGGWFQEGMRWMDYYEDVDDELQPYVQAIFDDVKENSIKLTGWENQHNNNGTVLFSDGKWAGFSMRAWGDLMAAIWSEIEDKNYCYLHFYC
jgi:hypothetical protein